MHAYLLNWSMFWPLAGPPGASLQILTGKEPFAAKNAVVCAQNHSQKSDRGPAFKRLIQCWKAVTDLKINIFERKKKRAVLANNGPRGAPQETLVKIFIFGMGGGCWNTFLGKGRVLFFRKIHRPKIGVELYSQIWSWSWHFFYCIYLQYIYENLVTKTDFYWENKHVLRSNYLFRSVLYPLMRHNSKTSPILAIQYQPKAFFAVDWHFAQL